MCTVMVGADTICYIKNHVAVMRALHKFHNRFQQSFATVLPSAQVSFAFAHQKKRDVFVQNSLQTKMFCSDSHVLLLVSTLLVLQVF